MGTALVVVSSLSCETLVVSSPLSEPQETSGSAASSAERSSAVMRVFNVEPFLNYRTYRIIELIMLVISVLIKLDAGNEERR